MTPGEARQLTHDDLLRVEALERSINAAMAHYRGEPLWIGIESAPRRVLDEVMEDCRRAGWRVRIESDQRDGTAIVLEEPR